MNENKIKFDKIGIIPNLHKPKSLEIAFQLISWLETKGVTVLLNEITANEVQRPDLATRPSDIYKSSDFIIVLGGDGTLLSVARQVTWYETPILGVNVGHLGFLTELELENIYEGIEKIYRGEYRVDKRMMLEAVAVKNNMITESFSALNDVVITKGSFSRIVQLKTFVNNRYIETYPADGLIISSPTGSTAYSLSAGGPILSPDVSGMVITPISPHTLNSRSIVISDKEEVKVEIVGDQNDVMLTIDGQQGYKLKTGDIIIVRKAEFSANMIRLTDRNFYDVLRTKLNERGCRKEE
ncbi:MAG: NAD kinase [Firmicutes bacterium]|nr:NAD kinase [Bacillota bacterium]MDI6705384.1 NAD(+)/NADH kinase [Bacillota bacterium]